MSDNAKAFAYPGSGAWATTGLTKRELFAAMAMQGMCGDSVRNGTFEQFASDAVRYADALLAALDKEQQK